MSTPGGTDRPAFDPRHDAIYQRGYQAGDSPAAQPGAAPAGTSRAAAARIGPPPTGPSSPTAAAFAGTVAADEIGDLDPLGFDSDGFHDELERPRWNPFIALLWVLGVALAGGGAALLWQTVGNMFRNNSYSGNGEPPVSFILQQFSYLVAPPLISAGLIILAGLLFWHAAAWRARRRITG
ncbi:hypothetical protein [Cryobacterium arcticum]|uniref:Uncharacterized protein n=1 Tax=Cryobacterium arcticum TaxID=670052 RepID=A0A1B1BF61_9MICO|nr:hypothetical protein [Cryobacterium arcticum]ANP71164.1 hypothetical protein PA27867_0190 [Cryobacterium arcticum]